MSHSIEARCYKSLVPLFQFERKDALLTKGDTRPRFCTYQVNGKTKMQRCNHGVHVRRRCDQRLATSNQDTSDPRLATFNKNTSLRKNYLNNYRAYR
jgi:hypothetical protein